MKRCLKCYGRTFGKIIVAVLILEILLFNYRSFVLFFGNYEERSLDLSQAQFLDVEGGTDQSGMLLSPRSDKGSITFHINQPVRTIYLDIASADFPGGVFPVHVSFSDATRDKEIEGNGSLFEVVPSVESSKYITCEYSGDVRSFSLLFKGMQDKNIQIREVSVNRAIPFRFSLFRVFGLTACGIVLFLLLRPELQVPISGMKRKHYNALFLALLAFCVLFAVMVFFVYVGDGGGKILGRQDGDQLSKELVDAFENRSVALLAQPSEELLSMDNPYDPNARIYAGIDFEWDHLLYQGKYYSYYGIGPVLTLFLPFHLLTGGYFPSVYAVLIYAAIAIAFLLFNYKKMMDTWFPETPISFFLCGLLMLFFTSGILILLNRPLFYEVAEASALCYFMIGLFLILSSDVLRKRKRIKTGRLFLSGVFLSLAVLSRATFALYVAAVVIWLVYRWIQDGEEKQGLFKRSCPYLIAAVPYVIFGGLQMGYNYARFGSPFEFGIRYSLSVTDFVHSQFHLKQAMISIWNFLFGIPFFNTKFPFLHGLPEYFSLNGYYFFETENVMGLFLRALPIFILPIAAVKYRKLSFAAKMKISALYIFPGVIAPVIILFTTWSSGHALRYNVDFAWQMLTLSLAFCFYKYNQISDETWRRVLLGLMVFSMAWCVFSNLTLVFQYPPGTDNMPFRTDAGLLRYCKIARDFMFWR